MATHPKQKLTFEEWLHLPQERTELIDGEVLARVDPTWWHQELVARLLMAFRLFLDAHGGGFVFIGGNVRLASDVGVCPDVQFMREYPADPLYIDGPPDLAIEVVSDTWRDLKVKRDRYERAGLPEYWAVLPEAERIEVRRLVDGAYGKPLIVEPGETISPLALPGLVIDVTALFHR